MPWKTPFSSDKLTLSRPNPPTSLSFSLNQSRPTWSGALRAGPQLMGFPKVPTCRPRGQGPRYCPAGCLAMTPPPPHTHTFFSPSREKQGNVHLLSGLSTPSNIACAGLSWGIPSECAPRAEKVASGPNARSPPRCGGCCC